jgi:ATPase family associated with various cellular activities (AAA)/ClpX C4-type zinc finger
MLMTIVMVSDGRCQFCHRTSSDVAQIVAGDSGFICDECVGACTAALTPKGVAAQAAENTERYAFQRLVRHFAPRPPHEIHATSRSFPIRQQADLQQALDALLGERRVPDTFVGIMASSRHEAVGYSTLLQRDRGRVDIAPPQHEEVDIGRGETVRCLKNGLWLLNDGTESYAVILSQLDDYGRGQSISLEIAVPPGDRGAAICSHLFDAIERRLSTQSCYRGRVLSLEQAYGWSGHAQRIQIHDLAPVDREALILPAETIKTIERNVLGFARQRPALRALGLSTQKGLLFHGPPGIGKTHCIRYLAGQLEDHTTLLITAEQVGLLPEYVALARLLQPALVVIEDADLIARERSEMATACDEVMLNRLLNELDGLRERADVFFILTTNRPEMLEPALISRPGRIDQAIEFPLPNASLRRRLIALYARGLSVSDALMDNLAGRTDGASPAFIKELLRRVAQHHLEQEGTREVSQTTADAALDEMLFSGGVLNKRLLGGEAVEGSAE